MAANICDTIGKLVGGNEKNPNFQNLKFQNSNDIKIYQNIVRKLFDVQKL